MTVALHRRVALAVLAALIVVAPALHGQQTPNTPHVGYVYPAGGREGTTERVTVGGQFLDGVTAAIVSGTGVHARVVEFKKPLTGRELTDLRERMQELQQHRGEPGAMKELIALRDQIADALRRNANPAISQLVTLEITIDQGAVNPATRSIRLVTPLGVTNPLVFCVGQLPEYREPEVADAGQVPEITLPVVVNGRIVPRDVDRYRFRARKGQQLVVAVSARDLMPYLADAVPGWFQATIAIRDSAGRELAYDDDYRFSPDPMLHYEVPSDDEYIVEIKDALYRGREDFVYRMAIGELPWVSSAFPLGARAGSRSSVELSGWNLHVRKIAMDLKSTAPGPYPVMVPGVPTSDHVLLAVDTLPEKLEREPNDSIKTAQPLTLPVIVNGRIDRPGDRDVFRFHGRAGQAIVAEVIARRLESPLDSVLELTDAAGRRLGYNDDHEDRATGLLTHSADSLLSVTLPSDGTYFLRLGDIQHKGGAEYAYRLRVSAPRSDFELRVTPSSISAGGNGTVPITVHAFRRDGFGGDVALRLKDAPPGSVLGGGLLAAGQDEARLTVTLPPSASAEPLRFRLEGEATIDGRAVVHEAVPADDMMQAFAYRHLVPADDAFVVITGRGATRVPTKVLDAAPARIPAGGETMVHVSVPPGYRAFENVRFELSDPPDGLTIDGPSDVTASSFRLRADARLVKPGLRGNLIVVVTGERVPPGNPQGRRRVQLGTLPAIPFEVTPPR